jgi:hypothetical protein
VPAERARWPTSPRNVEPFSGRFRNEFLTEPLFKSLAHPPLAPAAPLTLQWH